MTNIVRTDRELLDWLQKQTKYGTWEVRGDGTEDNALQLIQTSPYNTKGSARVRIAIIEAIERLGG